MAEGNHNTMPMAISNSTKLRLKALYPKVADVETSLPRSWCPKEKFSHIGLSNGGLRVQFFKGHSDSNREGVTVKSNISIPPPTGLYYFEVKILSKGREGNIAVGLTTPCASLHSLLGMDKHSYAYHGAEGNVYNYKTNTPYGPSFTTGDVVGCGINFVYNTCFYTKNGHYLGIAFKDMPKNLYPTVGLHAVGAVVDANFGHIPFVFDIEDMMKEMKSKAKDIIYNFSFPSTDSEYQDMMHKLVSSYLLHNGYCATAQKFASDTGQEFNENIEAIQNRRNIMNLVIAGRIQEAIDSTERYYPGLLDNKPNLLFRLKCRQFIEMINSSRQSNKESVHNNRMNGDTETEYMETDSNGYPEEPCNGRLSSVEKILEFGKELYTMSQRLFRLYGSNKKNKSMLRNAFSLLAYSNPHNSPVGWQLDPSQREAILVELNCAILKDSNASMKPPLELALAHAQNLLNLMSKSGIGLASFTDINDYL